MISGNQLLPSGRCGKPPNPLPFLRNSSSSDGPRERARPPGSGVGSHGFTGSAFDPLPRSVALFAPPGSPESGESHGPLLSVAKITGPCLSNLVLIKPL
jgi:hypothetical protein